MQPQNDYLLFDMPLKGYEVLEFALSRVVGVFFLRINTRYLPEIPFPATPQIDFLSSVIVPSR